MSFSLLELAQNYFLGTTVRQTSTAFGEGEPNISQGLQSVVPLALGGLLIHAQRPGGATDLTTQAQHVYTRGLLGDLSELLQELQSSSAIEKVGSDRGEDMLRSLLGSDYPTAVASISQQAGLRVETVRNLLRVAVAVALGLIGRHLAQQKLGPTGLVSYLASQRDTIQHAVKALPGAVGSTLADLLSSATPTTAKTVMQISNSADQPASLRGSGTTLATEPTAISVDLGQPLTTSTRATADVGNSSSQITATLPQEASFPAGPASSISTADKAQPNSHSTPRSRVQPAVRAALPAARPAMRWSWLLVLLGVALLGYFGAKYWQHGLAQPATVQAPISVEETTPVSTSTTGHYEATSDTYRYDPGATLLVQLPTGPKLSVCEHTAEAQLFYLLTDSPKAQPDHAQAGIRLGQVNFDKGTATLTAASQAQLVSLAALLRAFPRARLKIGGFMDNQGPAEASLLLSADRANAVRNALIYQGLSPSQVVAQGYGQAHPLASNDTREGRAQNRRVAILLTEK